MVALFKNKKILYDGSEFIFFEKNLIREVSKENFSFNGGSVEIILTENLYSFETLDKKLIDGFTENEILKFIEWKATSRGENTPLITYKKLGGTIFSFTFNGYMELKSIFNGKIKAIKTFSFSVYNFLRKNIERNSLLLINYKNLFVFLAIGEREPVFLRKKMNLTEDEIESEAITTIKYVKERFGFELSSTYSNIPLPLENFMLIEKKFLEGILR